MTLHYMPGDTVQTYPPLWILTVVLSFIQFESFIVITGKSVWLLPSTINPIDEVIKYSIIALFTYQ